MEKSCFNETFMNLKGQNIFLNRVFFQDVSFSRYRFGEMGPDFQSTVYFFSGCWLCFVFLMAFYPGPGKVKSPILFIRKIVQH